MLKKITPWITGCAIMLFGCAERQQPVNFSEELPGTWKLVQVIESNKDITKKRNPKDDRIMRFRADSTYLSKGAPYPPKTGKWSLDGEQNDLLFLDSDAGAGDDSKWKLSHEDDTLFCRGHSLVIKNVETKWTKMNDAGNPPGKRP